MTTKTQSEHLDLLVEEFLSELEMLSDAEVVSEAAEDFDDLDAVVQALRAEVQSAKAHVAKATLAAARSAAASHKETAAETKMDIERAKKLFDEFISAESGRSRFTMAARKGNAGSQADVMSALSDFCQLLSCSHAVPRLSFGDAPKAEHLLKSLGVSEPEEIDVEAIAWHLGATVRYAPLEGCEARIIGADDSAVITVNSASSAQRQRFSVCHELGHWIYHRRRMLFCQGDEIERPSPEAANMERAADRFASELLMPDFLFRPISGEFGRPTMAAVRKLAGRFNVSQTAAAIRLVETNHAPILLICHGQNGRKWFARSSAVTSDWFPKSELSPESSAFTMIYGKAPDAMPAKSVSASTWFARADASRYEVVEESIRVASREVLTLLVFKNPGELSRQLA
ncbi:ImmA/IrrE family metallo-endopeptidase [Bradyrhizobium sp. CIAT3101]|uniref:ImmA/IrrE family metallo-endopeptidase n=1 Tax=Bradyrhizobium sp. CIAT3101 TaxID=439387 RepID=UPI0024B15D3D|nr:ImmA/IrrE family metallo-endopeptidase [Bradyrhizobium sp. CIAT3101]WFU79938.1 ImmA/IrrE family metallo-endopeptidase [Bradyrhizobium sp. CIAT3101]